MMNNTVFAEVDHVTQLALYVNDLANVLDRQSQADVVIMDFSKDFDLVPHQTSFKTLPLK